MKYAGIDPGKKGAIVDISDKGRIRSWAMPLRKDGSIDLDELCSIIDKLSADFISLELIHSIYGTGKGSMFTMGRGLGNIEAALHCNGKQFEYVKPTDWQARVWSAKDIVKKKSKSGKKMVNDTKATSLRAAKRLYPKHDFRYADNETKHKGRERKKAHDGIVDAVLIAHYSRIYLSKKLDKDDI